ncbi:hypothetical protein QR680_001693 [Steinernema hermaphroditum]|uniref:Uncharacterized protein n=1 Tax=Steinernema hermaphroditum TaxID=289476 RepID=A0AA39GZE4_9BILA|nr:hypothetical protein QR680_001693 [Steinernema hermaphroditum]
MIRHLCLLMLLLGYCAGTFARFDRISECERICAVGMSAECCECIGCHQAMRFGKRAFHSEEEIEGLNWPRSYRGRFRPLLNAQKLLELLSGYDILLPREDK